MSNSQYADYEPLTYTLLVLLEFKRIKKWITEGLEMNRKKGESQVQLIS